MTQHKPFKSNLLWSAFIKLSTIAIAAVTCYLVAVIVVETSKF